MASLNASASTGSSNDPTRNVRTSLDISANELPKLTDRMRGNLENLHRAIGTAEHINQPVLDRVIGDILDSLPVELKKDLQGQLPEIKADLTRTFVEYANRVRQNPKGEPTDADLELLMDGVILSLIEHQGVTLMAMRGIDKDPAVLANYEPRITNKHLSVASQRVATILTWGASFYTSFGYFQEQVGAIGCKIGLSPAVIQRLGAILPPFLSTFSSQTVRMLKEEAEKIAMSEKISIFKAPLRIISNTFKRGPQDRPRSAMVVSTAASYLALKFLVAFLDAYSNLTGFATLQLRSEVVKEAIDAGEKKIDERIGEVRGQIDKMHAGNGSVIAKFEGNVKHDIDAEAKGESKTGTAGAGPMYHAKQFMYNDELVSRAFLEESVETIMAKAKAEKKPMTPERAAQQYKLRHDFLKAIKDAGITSNSATPLPQEIAHTMDDKFKKIEALIAEIQTLEKAQDPERNVAFTRLDFTAMTDKFGEIMKIINDELPKDVNAQVDGYNKLNERLAKIALESGLYKNFKPGSIAPWSFEGFQMDNKEISIPAAPYVDGDNLLHYMKMHWEGKTIALRLLEYLAISIFISYADLAFLPLTRKAYEKDTAEAKEKRAIWMKNYREKMIAIVTRQLNEGMFGNHFHGTAQNVDAATVAQIVDQRIAELTAAKLTAKSGRDNKWIQRMVKWTPFSPPADYVGWTEVAQRHNAEVAAMQEIMGSASEMGKIYQGVHPGLDLVKNPRPGETPDNVRRLDDKVTEERGAALEQQRIMDIRNRIRGIKKSGTEGMSSQTWENVWDAFVLQEGELSALTGGASLAVAYQTNANDATVAVDESNQTRSYLESLLPKIVRREAHDTGAFASETDAVLLARQESLTTLEAMLKGLDTSRDIDLHNDVEAALRGITKILEDITAARTQKAKGVKLADRQAQLKDTKDKTDKAISAVSSWLKTSHQGDSEKIAADKVATLLGEKHVITVLKPGEKVSASEASVMVDQYLAIMSDLKTGFHLEDDSAQKAVIQDLGDKLAESMKLLVAYFPDDYVPPAEFILPGDTVPAAVASA